MFFGPVICTDLQLICTLQVSANQALPTLKKQCKTRANHCKSLQITGPKNHRKNDADLRPPGRVKPGQQAVGTESAFFSEAGRVALTHFVP